MARLAKGTGWLPATPSAEAGADPPVPVTGEHPRVPTARPVPVGPRLARAIVLAVLACSAAVQVIDVATVSLPSAGIKLTVDFVALAGIVALTTLVTSTAVERWPPGRRLAVLLAEAVLAYLPLVVLGRYWAETAGFFAGSALLLLSGWVAWAVFAAVVLGMVPVAAATAAGLGAGGAARLTLSTLVLGLVVFALARLSLALRYVNAARAERAQVAVIGERTRFARDLHDLLGYSLSAITLKAEITKRLVASNPGRARDELTEVLDIARQSLADVRTMASGYRSVSLAKEASSATSLLATAGVDAQVDISCGALDEKVDTELAAVLREAVTNMLRHSTPRNCVIEADVVADTIRVAVRNDGVPRLALSGRDGGGLDNLRARLEAIGGTLNVEVRGDDWYSVLAEAPLDPG